MPSNPCPLCDHSLRNHGEDFCNFCGKCDGKTFDFRRKYVAGQFVPRALETLEPLANALGFLWLFRSKKWGVVDSESGRRVHSGMSEVEAAEYVVSLAVHRLKDRGDKLDRIARDLETLARIARKGTNKR